MGENLKSSIKIISFIIKLRHKQQANNHKKIDNQCKNNPNPWHKTVFKF